MATFQEIIRQRINTIYQSTGQLSLDFGYSELLRGLNHRGEALNTDSNRDTGGIVFHTRPDMNLSYDNISRERCLMPLATSSAEYSLQRYIRTILDPRGAIFRNVRTPLVDELNPFIPLLTNTLTSLSGWQDLVGDVYRSPEGVLKETWAKFDGRIKIRSGFPLTATYANIHGDPITALFYTWLLYMDSVTHDPFGLVPYTDNQIRREKDYESRIYHFVLDPTKRFIRASLACWYAAPLTVPIGAKFNFNVNEDLNVGNDQITINWECTGADYNDPITFHEFNKLVGLYNTGLTITQYDSAGNMTVKGDYIKLNPTELKAANYLGTPLIQPLTNELTWWVKPSVYREIQDRL